ncbi:adrenoceptor beta 3b [Electrophorus electricus]|uniref:adrenoceptor beta 3b n=1 Tax=Electrophorus electricus TaxID=8005 RepID=UPI0015D06D18|nr:adrenoceptor beta 3b [Electrophorus electricus]
MSDHMSVLQSMSSNSSYQASNHSGPSSSLESLLILPLALIIFLTVSGNLLVILSVSLTPQLHTTTGVFITSLACADLIVGCVVQPLALLLLLQSEWTLGRTACDLWMSVDVLCVTASIHTMCAIAVDRYVAITRPLRRRALLGKQRARLVVGAVWVCSALVSFVPIMGQYTVRTGSKEAEECSGNSTCCDFIITPSYAIFSSVVSFYMPLLLMLLLYSRVFVIARRQVRLINKDNLRFLRDQTQQRHAPPAPPEPCQSPGRGHTWPVVQQHTALKTLGLIIGIFTACWLPFFVANVVRAMVPSVPGKNVFMLLNWLGYINSGLNPVIYCHSSDYRTAFRNILRRVRHKGLAVWKQAPLWCVCWRRTGPLGHAGLEVAEQA